MGQNRTDTAIQIAAKVRGAETRKCKCCGRKNAMSTPAWYDVERDGWQGTIRICRWCGASKTFARVGDQYETTWREAASDGH